jgi:hypothetical protein
MRSSIDMLAKQTGVSGMFPEGFEIPSTVSLSSVDWWTKSAEKATKRFILIFS